MDTKNAHSNMVAVKIFYENDLSVGYANKNVHAFMPIFVDGDQLKDNIEKRIRFSYLNDEKIKKIGWNVVGEETEVFWLDI